jgi:hypothetical protein
MAKQLLLTSAEQSLAVKNIPSRYQVTPKDGETVLYDGVIEINEITTERAFVPLTNLLTFNGWRAYTINDAVLEATL